MTKVLERLSARKRDRRSDDNESGCPGRNEHQSGNATNRLSFPVRDCEGLYASTATVDCALHNCCVPCAYKIGCFDVAWDNEFCRLVPNQRPELCPRIVRAQPAANAQLPYGYRAGMNILTVGDGDLTFSLAIARLLLSPSNRDKPTVTATTKIVATSYEPEETLERVYPNFADTKHQLQQLGVQVHFNVDATNLEKTMPMDPCRFDRVVWNFPCTAIGDGQDGQNQQMEHNKQLLSRFSASVQPYLRESSDIHMNHKTKPPYNHWKLEDHVTAPAQLRFVGKVVFDRSLVMPYIPRKALDKKSFPYHDACVYMFQSSNTRKNRVPGDDMIPVTVELIQQIRTKHTEHKKRHQLLAAVDSRSRRKKKKQKHTKNSRI